jgi:hypothetical protein
VIGTVNSLKVEIFTQYSHADTGRGSYVSQGSSILQTSSDVPGAWEPHLTLHRDFKDIITASTLSEAGFLRHWVEFKDIHHKNNPHLSSDFKETSTTTTGINDHVVPLTAQNSLTMLGSEMQASSGGFSYAGNIPEDFHLFLLRYSSRT